MNARVLFVTHGPTAATRTASFPAADEPLLERARLDIPRGFARAAVRTAPELRARQTAAGLDPVVDDGLRDLDAGAWTGRPLDEADPQDVAAMIADPAAAPHGGESIGALVERVGAWLDTITGPTVAVTHHAVVRGAVLHVLQAPPSAFWRVDVEPGARVDLRGGPGRWALRFNAG